MATRKGAKTSTTTTTSPSPADQGSSSSLSRLASYQRYNDSPKGRARRERYEVANPERATRWSPIMVIKGRDRNGAI